MIRTVVTNRQLFEFVSVYYRPETRFLDRRSNHLFITRNDNRQNPRQYIVQRLDLNECRYIICPLGTLTWSRYYVFESALLPTFWKIAKLQVLIIPWYTYVCLVIHWTMIIFYPKFVMLIIVITNRACECDAHTRLVGNSHALKKKKKFVFNLITYREQRKKNTSDTRRKPSWNDYHLQPCDKRARPLGIDRTDRIK